MCCLSLTQQLNPVIWHLLENQARHTHHKMHLWRNTCSRIESLEVMVVILNLCGQERSPELAECPQCREAEGKFASAHHPPAPTDQP